MVSETKSEQIRPEMLMRSQEIRELLAGDGHAPLTEMAISKFVEEGMPKHRRGEYDGLACARWYLGRLRTRAHIRESKAEAKLKAELSEIGL